jgi:uncharacterized protein
VEEKLFFRNSKGNRLCGILSNPIRDKSNPIIICLHGFASNKNRPTYTTLSEELNKKNISSFRFDFFGHGESEGNFFDLTNSQAIDDTLQAIEFIRSLGYKKIGLVGSSFGGLAATIAASKTKDIYLLALKCPVSTYFEFKDYKDKNIIADWKKTGYSIREGKKLGYSFYEDIKNNVAYDVAEKIIIPTIIVHGDADIEVPLSQSVRLSKIIPNCELKIIKGAGHYFKEGDSNRQLLDALTGFIVKNS